VSAGVDKVVKGDRNARLAWRLVLVVGGMLGLAYAAVPLYQAFCRATGFAGTPLVAVGRPAVIAARSMCAVPVRRQPSGAGRALSGCIWRQAGPLPRPNVSQRPSSAPTNVRQIVGAVVRSPASCFPKALRPGRSVRCPCSSSSRP
jgi:hypothetical protein